MGLEVKIKYILKVKRMQRSGTEAIGTQIKPLKPKRGNNKMTVKIQREHMVNQVSSYFPKGGHSDSATKTELKII